MATEEEVVRKFLLQMYFVQRVYDFTNTENFDGNSGLPSLPNRLLRPKTTKTGAISTDLQSESSILLQLGIENIAINGNLSHRYRKFSLLRQMVFLCKE